MLWQPFVFHTIYVHLSHSKASRSRSFLQTQPSSAHSPMMTSHIRLLLTQCAITFSKDDLAMSAIRINYFRETHPNPYGIGDVDSNVHDASTMPRKPMTPPQTPTPTPTTKCSRPKKYSTRSPRTAAHSTRFSLARTKHCDIFALSIRVSPSVRCVHVLCMFSFNVCLHFKSAVCTLSMCEYCMHTCVCTFLYMHREYI